MIKYGNQTRAPDCTHKKARNVTSLFYLRARYYDPGTGQFISRDPMVTTTRQPYAYVADNPLNATDPMGLCAWNDFGCFAGNLAALPGAILHDAGQGQDNFIKNIQDPNLRPLVAVGAAAFAVGATLYGVAAASALGAGALAGEGGALSYRAVVGITGLVITGLVVKECGDPSRGRGQLPPPGAHDLVPVPNYGPPTPSPSPGPSPSPWGPYAP